MSSFRSTARTSLTIAEKEEIDRGQIPPGLGEKLYRGVLPEERALSLPDTATAANPVVLTDNAGLVTTAERTNFLTTAQKAAIPTTDQKASFAVGASAANPLVAEDFANLLTSDEKAAIPLGVSASEPLISSSNIRLGVLYTSAMDALGAEWTQTVPADTSIAIVADRTRLTVDVGAASYPKMVLGTELSSFPIIVQAYIKNISLQNNITANIRLIHASTFIGAGLQQSAGGANLFSLSCDSSTFPAAPANALWLKYAFLGEKMATFYSLNAEGVPPTNADWVEFGTRSSQVVLTKWVIPCNLELNVVSGIGLLSSFDFSHLTVTSG